jgi:hypothetical protein
MDIETRNRLIRINRRLRAVLADSCLPPSLAEAAHRCVIDIDCALATDVNNGSASMLLAQAGALITVAAQTREPSGATGG